jgi:hypothetical protein
MNYRVVKKDTQSLLKIFPNGVHSEIKTMATHE